MSKPIRFNPDWLFCFNVSKRSRWLWYLVLYAAGAAVWAFFLNGGRIGFDLHDWTQEGPRLDFLRSALKQGVFPLHISSPLFAGERFLSIPDTLFSPQVLLLRVMEPGAFVLANLLLMYTVGFTGIVVLAERRKWSPLAAGLVFLLLNFNGQLTAQIAVGHTMWMTAFLLPFFVMLVFEALEGAGLWRWVLQVSVLMLVMFLQGGFHFVTWSLLFLAALGLAVPELRKHAAAGFGFSLILCMPRILPTAVEMAGVRRSFISGYYSLADMLQGLVALRFPHEVAVEKYSSLGWWEADMYIGLAGFGLLLLGAWWAWKDVKYSPRKLLLPMFLFGLLSLGKVYQPVTMLPVPLFNAQRVTTRLLLLPLVFLVIMSGDQVTRVLSGARFTTGSRILAAGMAVVLGHDLMQHTRLWRVENMDQLFTRTPVDISAEVLVMHDPVYAAALLLGTALAAAGAGVLVYLASREKRSRQI